MLIAASPAIGNGGPRLGSPTLDAFRAHTSPPLHLAVAGPPMAVTMQSHSAVLGGTPADAGPLASALAILAIPPQLGLCATVRERKQVHMTWWATLVEAGIP